MTANFKPFKLILMNTIEQYQQDILTDMVAEFYNDQLDDKTLSPAIWILDKGISKEEQKRFLELIENK